MSVLTMVLNLHDIPSPNINPDQKRRKTNDFVFFFWAAENLLWRRRECEYHYYKTFGILINPPGQRKTEK